MRTPLVVAVVVVVHALAVGSVMLIQGCGTAVGPGGPPPEPVMPESVVVTPPAPITRIVPTPSRIPDARSWDVAETTTYVVGRGDTLSGVAQRFDLGVSDILALNHLSNPNVIRAGQRLVLPGRIDVDAKPRPQVASRPKVVAVGAGEAYVVKSGDSLSVIAHRMGSSIKAIKQANGLTSDLIRVGQKLKIPGAKATAPDAAGVPAPEVPAFELDTAPVESVSPPTPVVPTVEAVTPAPAPAPAPAPTPAPAPDLTGWKGQTHTVKEGEDLYSVALWWNVSLSELKELNGLTDTKLRPGVVLKIPMAE
jgi:peptidoglycan DL-endopeptidase LytF